MIKNKLLITLALWISLWPAIGFSAEQPQSWIDWIYNKITAIWQKKTNIPTKEQPSLTVKTNLSSVKDFRAILAHNFPGDDSTTNDTIEELKKRYPKGTPEHQALAQALEEMFIDRMKAKFTPDMSIKEKLRLTLAERNKIYNYGGSIFVEGEGPMPGNEIRNANLGYRNQGLDKLYKELYDQSIAEQHK